MFAGIVQRVAKATKNHTSVQSSMSFIIAHIKYLHHAKWIPPSNVDDALDELQSNSRWTALTTSTKRVSQDDVNESITSSHTPTSPPFEIYLTKDWPQMRNPAYTPLSEYTDTATTPMVTITASSDGSDSKDSFEAEIAATTKSQANLNANYDKQHPYLKIGDHHPKWLTLPSTPFKGTDMIPSALIYCGSSPGEDWKYNDHVKLYYYHYLIPSPETGKFVVVPWIKFDLVQACPEVSATFGKYHPEYLKVLCPTPVDYDTEIISPQQACLFHKEKAFVLAIDIILLELCPPDIEAGIRHYRYYHTVTKPIKIKLQMPRSTI